MTTQLRKLVIACCVLTCLSAVITGCGKKDEAPPQTPAQQQLRNDKKGD